MGSIALKLKQGLTCVGKRVLKTGLASLRDAAAGGSLKSSCERRAQQILMTFST